MLSRAIVTSIALVMLVTLWNLNQAYSYAGVPDSVPPLTAQALTDPRASGKTFRVEGRATSVYRTRGGLIVLKLHSQKENLHIEVPVFPSLGKLPQEPAVGDQVEVIGNLGRYKERWQLKPLASAHVSVLGAPRADEAMPLQQALSRRGETLLIGPVTLEEAQPFTSKAGKKHLRVVVADKGAVVGGIMYQGSWSERSIPRAGSRILMLAKVDDFRGQPSLVIERIQAAP